MERRILLSFVCLIYIYLCAAASPSVNFNCDSSNRVVFPTKDLTKLRIVKDDGNLCTPTTGDFKNCKVKDNSDVRVLYTEEKDANVVGGKSLLRYEVMCIDKKQVVKVSVTNMQVSASTTPTYATKSMSPDISVKMVISKNGQNIGTTAVSIGEQLKLEITGPANHTTRVDNCTATDGNLSHDIWKPCGSHDEAIISKDWTSVGDILSNDLFAFRFINTMKVDISCYVSVCPKSNDALCQLQTCSNGRRRRDADDFESNEELSSENAVASVSFNVKNDQTFNSSPGLLANILVYTVAVLITMLSTR